MRVLDYLKDNIVILDGAMGSLMQKRGLKVGELPEEWNITHSDVITEIHKEYYDAGSNIVCTNTFGANTLKFEVNHLEEIIKAAIENAKRAQKLSSGNQEKFVAGDIGPLGKLLKPFGDLDFLDAVEIFKTTARLCEKHGADLIVVETMNDCYETKAALLAVKESTSLPVFVTNAYSENDKLMTGASPKAMVAMLEGLGADAIGLNCSFGPKKLRKVMEEIFENASVPVIFKPNAGLPKIVNGITIYDVDAQEFSNDVADAIKMGVRCAGGCCGTTPEYIKCLSDKVRDFTPVAIEKKNKTIVSCGQSSVEFENVILIGERINPTGNKRVKEAINNNEIDYLLTEGINEQESGAHILDVNVGVPGIDEKKVLTEAVYELQGVVNIPLSIDSSDTQALESALRIYNGKPLINSVNGKEESMKAVFPLVKKYGGVVVALTLDEKGIPKDAEGRVEIAKKILKTASTYGIEKNNIVFDALTMSVSTNENAGNITAKAVNIITNELKCNTVLGVSNISFGMPNRDEINSKFFLYAMQNGLSSAIMNPYSKNMMKAYQDYTGNTDVKISFDDTVSSTMKDIASSVSSDESDYDSELQYAIIKGLKERAHSLTEELLETIDPITIVKDEIVPALDVVGKGYEEQRMYLPQLLMAAEASKASFEAIKKKMPSSGASIEGKIIIATVHGDIHDIGKNIVKLILENYGFDVLDLGKDVLPQTILDAAVENKAKIVCLSALMTTTVPAMEETIKLLRKNYDVKVAVGGAVLTQEYADKIGADFYSKDAMGTVRYANKLLG